VTELEKLGSSMPEMGADLVETIILAYFDEIRR
jgi:hypothetical protein